MRFPLTISAHNSLIIAKADFFNGIGGIYPERQQLEIALSRHGQGSWQWLIDADGLFYSLTHQGLKPPSLLTHLKLKRRRETYALAAGRAITGTELLELLQNHNDAQPELPNVADLRTHATAQMQDAINRDFMRQYLGE